MSKRAALVLAVAVIASSGVSVSIVAQRPAPPKPAAAAAPYFPERFDWQHKKPEDVGMSAALVNEAVQTAIAAETPGPKDMALFLHSSFGKEPYNTIVGPIKDRGPASGIIARH